MRLYKNQSIKYCKFCKEKTIFSKMGFPESNEREECSGCGVIKISFYSRWFGAYAGYPKYIQGKDWNTLK